jgi:dihydrofolate synthase/folylpolyglutamate synthase
VAAAEAFFSRPLDEEVVESALAAVRVPGRLEVLRRHPLVVVDGAHNVAGMAALADALDEGFSVPGRTVAVVGMLRGRDPSAMLAPLARVGVDELFVCEPHSLRAMPASEVADAARGVGLAVTVAPTVEDAVAAASARVDEDGLLVAAGSLYVAADARVLLAKGAARG